MKHIAIILLLLCAAAFGATRTWDGSESDAWNTALNWSGDTVPVSGDIVTFASANNCTMPSGGTVPPTGAFASMSAAFFSGILDFNGASVDVDGTVDLPAFGGSTIIASSASSLECGGMFATTMDLPANLTVTLNGTDASLAPTPGDDNLASLVIDAPADIATAGNQHWGAYRYIAGTFNTITSGDLTDVTAGGAGSVDWNSSANRLNVLVINSGATATFTGDVFVRTLGGSGSLDLGTQTVNLSSLFEGAGFTVTGSAVGGLPATIEGTGTIQNVDATGAHIDARGISGSQPVDGGGNDNVRFSRGLVGGGVF